MKVKAVTTLALALIASAAMADDLMDFLAAHSERQSKLAKAGQGDHDAMYRLALKYEKGTEGVKADRGQMLDWLRRASDLGNGMASYKLFTYYAADPAGYLMAAKYWGLAHRQGYCGPPIIGNARSTKLAVQRCATG